MVLIGHKILTVALLGEAWRRSCGREVEKRPPLMTRAGDP
jgi:hypothetical protein